MRHISVSTWKYLWNTAMRSGDIWSKASEQEHLSFGMWIKHSIAVQSLLTSFSWVILWFFGKTQMQSLNFWTLKEKCMLLVNRTFNMIVETYLMPSSFTVQEIATLLFSIWQQNTFYKAQDLRHHLNGWHLVPYEPHQKALNLSCNGWKSCRGKQTHEPPTVLTALFQIRGKK